MRSWPRIQLKIQRQLNKVARRSSGIRQIFWCMYWDCRNSNIFILTNRRRRYICFLWLPSRLLSKNKIIFLKLWNQSVENSSYQISQFGWVLWSAKNGKSIKLVGNWARSLQKLKITIFRYKRTRVRNEAMVHRIVTCINQWSKLQTSNKRDKHHNWTPLCRWENNKRTYKLCSSC